jgi:uncharacterized protein
MTNPTVPPPADDRGNIANVVALYEALAHRDVPAALSLLVPEPVWDITPGAPDGGVYRGSAQVFGDFYPRLAARFPTFEVHPDTFVDGGDVVVAAGHYRFAAHPGAPTGSARFAHLFRFTPEGRITGVWQVADTALLAPPAREVTG